ncbi:MAG: RelA/SpoT domain-containing protein [Planctomycetota bacterium]|jgi:putative GTP pyrophosphokinase
MTQATADPEGFPGGSKSRVNAAGNRIRDREHTPDDLAVVDEWRAAHRAVLNTFQAILRNRTKGTGVTVAQRHKRKRTIFDKLLRLPGMQLARMDDVAGCRLIFKTVDALYAFRAEFHQAHFNHRRRNDIEKYDYIKRPKTTGYRGVHDVYEYNVSSLEGRRLAGLSVEIQYRTLVQHAWATAVEVIGHITTSQPKFQRGDRRYHDAMALASEILARAHEGRRGPCPDLGDSDLVQQFLAADKELGLLKTLGGLNTAKQQVSGNRNTILIFELSGELSIQTYRDATDAIRALFDLEKKHPDRDIVLVRADTAAQMRSAFRNYFSDARDFISLINDGCAKLASGGKKLIRARGSE